MAKKFYAYFFNEFDNGIVNNWDECKAIVQNSKARYKSFTSYDDAQLWLNNGANYERKKNGTNIVLEEGIYFDAGTGRNRGVEVRITDKVGNSLIHLLINDDFNNFLNKNSWFINEFNNVELGKEKTNNYGELLAFYLALECAKKTNSKKIFGDSQLVINYWSKGQFHAEKLSQETISLIQRVIKNRKKFEESGASVEYISGDINPADLGFHK